MSKRIHFLLLLAALPGFLAAALAQTPNTESPLDQEPSSEPALTQPDDPVGIDPVPNNDLQTDPPTPKSTTESAEATATESTTAETESAKDDNVIKFDPSKAVVRPAKVVKPRTPIRSVPPPKHSGNPQADLFEHAQLLSKHKMWPQAERQYRVYVENYPRSANASAAYYGLAEARFQLNKLAESEATFRAMLAKFKRGKFVGEAGYRLGKLHYDRQEYKEALPYFQVAGSRAEKELVRISAEFFRARCLQQLKNVRSAEAIYRRLAADEGDHPFKEASLVVLARMDVDAKRMDDAYAKFTHLAKYAKEMNIKAEAMTKSGLVGAKLGKTEEARAYFDEILKVDTLDAKAWHPKAFWGLLHLYYEQGQFEELIQQYQERRLSYNSTQLDQGQERVVFMVAHAFRRLERYRQAATLYEQVVKINPNGPESREAGYRHLYCLYKDQSPFLTARTEDYLTQQRLTDTKHQYYHLALMLKAESLFARKQKTKDVWTEAAETYAKINLPMIPEEYHPWVTYKLGWSYVEAGQYDKGSTAFFTFINEYGEQHPDLVPKVLAKRGEAFRKVRDYRRAIEDFDKIITDAPDQQLVNLAMQQKSLIMIEREDYAGAITSFQEMLNKFPEGQGSSEAYFFIGDSHYKLNQFEEAVAPLTKARQLDPQTYTVPATRRIIVCHWRQSDVDNAAKEVDILLKKDPKTNLVPPKLWLWLGTRSFQRDKYEDAARYLRQVAKPDAAEDTWPLAWSFLGRAYLNSGMYKEAIPPLDHYLNTSPPIDERAKTLLYKATALSKIGKLTEAQSTAEEVHQLQRQGRTYGQAWILLGDIAMAQEDFERASKHYVIPSRMFKDPLVTPVALEKAAIAFEKMEETQRGADLRRQLREEWPNYQSAEESDKTS